MLKIDGADNFRRTLVGLCLIIAPLMLLLGNIIHPGGKGGAGLVNMMAEHPGRVEAASLLIIFSSVFFVPALVGLLYLLRDRGVVLGHIGVGLALIGVVVGHAVWAGFQIVLLGFVQNGVDRGQLSAIADSGPLNVGFVIVLLMFLVGFFVGLIILAISLWRGRAAPLWVAACIIAAVVWDFIPLPGIAEVEIGPALLFVGLGWIGLKVLRMSDADWERGNLPSSGGLGVGAQPRVQ